MSCPEAFEWSRAVAVVACCAMVFGIVWLLLHYGTKE